MARKHRRTFAAYQLVLRSLGFESEILERAPSTDWLHVRLTIESSNAVRELCHPLFLLLQEFGEWNGGSQLDFKALGPGGQVAMKIPLRETPPYGWVTQLDRRGAAGLPAEVMFSRGSFARLLAENMQAFATTVDAVPTYGKVPPPDPASTKNAVPPGFHLMVFRPNVPKKEDSNGYCEPWNVDPSEWSDEERGTVASAVSALREQTDRGYRFYQMIALVGGRQGRDLTKFRKLELPEQTVIGEVANGEDLLSLFGSLFAKPV